MTPAELKTNREALGLPVSWLAAQAEVSERTVRYWESGRNQVPEDVVDIIEHVEAVARDFVDQALTVVAEATAEHSGPPEVIDLRRFATDAELWRQHPEVRPLPATWHAACLARIARELEARGIPAVIEYAH